jgi:hypothetical protein
LNVCDHQEDEGLVCRPTKENPTQKMTNRKNMKTKSISIARLYFSKTFALGLGLAGLLPLALPWHVMAQSGPTLPVYHVIQSGALPAQANALASLLNVPTDVMSLTNGEVSFIDPTNYMAIPTIPVTDPVIISNLLAQTPNKIPGIPIAFQSIDLNTLSNSTVMSSNAAVSLFAGTLSDSGLVPYSAVPAVSHALLQTIYTNDDGQVLTSSNYLDTKVRYQFTLGGIPLIGPGAQVQADFGANGNVTRLLYAARQLTPGPMVNIISSTEASNRAAALYPGFNGQFSVQLVYFAPSLALVTVSNIIPFYLCGGSGSVTNPNTGEISTLDLVKQLIPATDDPAYVPSVTLMANTTPDGTQVMANAGVTGGTPPYTFVWGGSGSNVSDTIGPVLTYTPEIHLAPPQLAVSSTAPDLLSVSWVDPSGLFQLQSSPSLQSSSWSPVAGASVSSNNVSSAPVRVVPGNSMFFRLVLSNSPGISTPENVQLTIVDANGIFVRRSHPLSVAARLIPIQVNINPQLLISWGTEGPYDQDFLKGDTESWRKAMGWAPNVGIQRFYRGEFVADKTDFIDPPAGNNDNIVDAADIIFYAGHGNTNSFSFTKQISGPSKPGQDLNAGDAKHAWGNNVSEWFCLLSCNVLAQGTYFSDVTLRWGPDFDGLHMMLGFSTEAYAGAETQPYGWGDTFEEQFVHGMAGTLNRPGWPMTIQVAWFNAADTTGPYGGSNLARTGDPAVLAPLGPSFVSDVNDYWWGQGTVGPRIRASQIHGWYYLTEAN